MKGESEGIWWAGVQKQGNSRPGGRMEQMYKEEAVSMTGGGPWGGSWAKFRTVTLR